MNPITRLVRALRTGPTRTPLDVLATAGVCTALAAGAVLGAAPAHAQPGLDAEGFTPADAVYITRVIDYSGIPKSDWPLGVDKRALVEAGKDGCQRLRAGHTPFQVRQHLGGTEDLAWSVLSAATRTYCPDQRPVLAAFLETY